MTFHTSGHFWPDSTRLLAFGPDGTRLFAFGPDGTRLSAFRPDGTRLSASGCRTSVLRPDSTRLFMLRPKSMGLNGPRVLSSHKVQDLPPLAVGFLCSGQTAQDFSCSGRTVQDFLWMSIKPSKYKDGSRSRKTSICGTWGGWGAMWLAGGGAAGDLGVSEPPYN